MGVELALDSAEHDSAAEMDGAPAPAIDYEMTDAELAAWEAFIDWCAEQDWDAETSEEVILRAMAEKLRDLGLEAPGMEDYLTPGA